MNRPSPAAAISPPAAEWVSLWLLSVIVGVVAMVVLGGIVRLAGAGLSIVEWAPVTGVLPPLSAEDWEAAFSAYRQTPEFRLVQSAITLAEFQQIYLLEYGHRLLGRALGILFLVPLVLPPLRRRIPSDRRRPLVAAAVLFAAQAGLGWAMVASGLQDRPWVSPYRLAAHLCLALGLLAVLLWQLLSLLCGPRPREDGRALRGPVLTALPLVATQVALGALVAGHKAGWVSTTFPQMMGAWLPPDIGTHGALGVIADPVTVHFVHRWFAFVALAGVLRVYGRSRAVPLPPIPARLATAAAVLAGCQVAIGVATVVLSVPVALASLHQAGGVSLFGLLVALLHQSRGPEHLTSGRAADARDVPRR